MKIIIIHGDYKVKSYERLQKLISEAKKRNWELINIDEQTKTIPEIVSGVSLFNKDKFIVLKNVLKVSKNETKWLLKEQSKYNGVLIIYNEDYLPTAFLKPFLNICKIEEYKLPKTMYVFMESIYPKNGKQTIQLFHKTIKNNQPEFVFSILIKHFRNLYWVKTDPKSLPYPAWRMGKLQKQAKYFTVQKIRQIINRLAEADIEIKTSKANIVSSLDLLFLTKLE